MKKILFLILVFVGVSLAQNTVITKISSVSPTDYNAKTGAVLITYNPTTGKFHAVQSDTSGSLKVIGTVSLSQETIDSLQASSTSNGSLESTQLLVKKLLELVRPSGLSYYSNLAGDFTATPVAGTNKVVISGLSFTFDHKDIMYAARRETAGLWSYLGVEPTVGTGDTLRFGTTMFLSTDQVDIVFIGPTKTQDKVLDLVKTNEQSPNWAKYIQESLEDVTNIAAGTAYYPSSTGASMDGYKSLSITGTLVDANDTSWLYLDVTNDEDRTNANWIQIYGYEAKTDTSINVITANNATTTFAWTFTDFNYAYYRVRVVTGDATNTLILKSRKVY